MRSEGRGASLYLTRYTLLATPYLLYLTCYTLLATPYPLHLTPYTLLAIPYSLYLTRYTLLATPYSLYLTHTQLQLGLGTVCCEVKSALLRHFTTVQLSNLVGFLDALRGGNWLFAVSALERTTFCTANTSRCSAVSSFLRIGCPAPDYWIETPKWSDVLASFSVSGARAVPVAIGAVRLELGEVSIAISGLLSCAGVGVAAHLPFSQRDANITFEVAWRCLLLTAFKSLATTYYLLLTTDYFLLTVLESLATT